MTETREATMAMKVGPAVPADAPRPVVAEEPHFRILSAGEDGSRYTLYLPGAHIPAAHTELPAVPAELHDGVWTPKRKGGRR